MIRFTGTENEKNSSFYRRNELIAHEWEGLASEIHGDAVGEYNCFHVDIKLQLPDTFGNVHIHGKHMLNSVLSDDFPLGSQYGGETTISTYLTNPPSGSFRIQRSNLLNVLTTNDEPYQNNRDYIIKADDKVLLTTILEDHPYSPKLWEHSMEDFHYEQKDGGLSLTLNRFLQDQDEIKELIDDFKHSCVLNSHVG
ncbi:MAG: hypothetical protein AB8F95_20430 [Bacteroidia bacterium]